MYSFILDSKYSTATSIVHVSGNVDTDDNMGRMQLKVSVWLPRPFFFPLSEYG